MADLKGPLLSVGAHGKIGNVLSFYRGKAGNKVRRFHMPAKTPTMSQYTRRMLIGFLTAHWQCMTSAQKEGWAEQAILSGTNLPAYQYFFHEAFRNMALHHGLVVYLSCNESTGQYAYDNSKSGNDGVLMPSYPTNVPSRVESFQKQYGNALLLDGIENNVLIPNMPNIQAIKPLTILLWFKSVGTSVSNGGLINKWAPGNREWHIGFTATGGLLDFVITDESTGGYIGRRKTGDTSFDQKWHFFAFVWDGTAADTGIKFYRDLIRYDTTARSGGTFIDIEPLSRFINLGFYWYVGTYLNAFIDEVCIYKRELSFTEIEKHFWLMRFNKKRQQKLVH